MFVFGNESSLVVVAMWMSKAYPDIDSRTARIEGTQREYSWTQALDECGAPTRWATANGARAHSSGPRCLANSASMQWTDS